MMSYYITEWEKDELDTGVSFYESVVLKGKLLVLLLLDVVAQRLNEIL